MGSAKIMIVEDNLIVAEDLRCKLTHLRYQVIAIAKSGEKALAAVEQQPPDLILMDIRLGEGISGIETAAILHQTYRIPVIYLTAYADEATITLAKQTEPYGYILKPFDEAELKSAIEVALYKQRAEQEIIASKEWLQTTLNSIGDGVITTDVAGKVVFMNPLAQTLTGWSEAEALGRSMGQIYHTVNQASGQAEAPPVTQVLREQTPVGRTGHTLLITRSGEHLPIADSAAPIKNDAGALIGVVLVFRDQTEERRAQKALQQSEAALKQAQQVAKMGSWRFDPSSGDSHWTEEIFAILDLPPQTEAIPFERLKTVVHPDDWTHFETTVNRCITDGVGFDMEFRITRPDQEIRHLHARCRVDTGAQGTVVAMLGTAQDITAQKRIETALRYEKEKVQQYLAVAGVMLIALDMDQTVRSINPKGCEILGYRQEEIIGRNWFDHFLPQQEIQTVKQVFNQIVAGDIEPVEYYENPVLRKDGSLREIAWHNSVLKDPSGKIIGLFSSGNDITERKRVEAALRHSEARYRLLFQASSNAIFIVDTESLVILDANAKAEALYGYSHAELLTLKATDLSAEPSKTVEALHRDHSKVVPLRYHKKKDGTVFPVEITSTYFHLDDRHVNLSNIRDVSEIKKIEMQLQQARKMESIGNLAGGIAHDFNNILSSMIGFTELALDDVAPDSVIAENLQEVYAAGKRAKELVQQILAFARQSDEAIKPIRVDTIIQEVLKLIRATIPVSIQIRPRIESRSLIMGNAVQVHQILMNLCTNAASAMEKAGGVLRVELIDLDLEATPVHQQMELAPGAYLQITVADTGVGIAPECIDLIFEPYFSTKGPAEGTGMGLAVVQGIVESYGGKISVQSTLNQGTCFTILLPASQRRPVSQYRETQDLPSGQERILFVDDEAPIAKMGGTLLTRLGYQVTTCTSSPEALALFRNDPHQFDLVITDMTMPKLSGDALAAELMAIRPEIPIILCTGHSTQITEESALQMGIQALLYKPIVRADLVNVVRRVLDESPVPACT